MYPRLPSGRVTSHDVPLQSDIPVPSVASSISIRTCLPLPKTEIKTSATKKRVCRDKFIVLVKKVFLDVSVVFIICSIISILFCAYNHNDCKSENDDMDLYSPSFIVFKQDKLMNYIV